MHTLVQVNCETASLVVTCQALSSLFTN